MVFPELIESLLAFTLHSVQHAPPEIAQMLSDSMAEDDPTFVRGWDRLLEMRLVLQICADLALALALASTIAFHPRRRGGALSAEQIEYPKTVLLYTVVGTMVAAIVVLSPPMALVVFGIGGLLRFRTDLGTAHATGHVILTTLVGVACGLGRYPMAIVATLVGWILIWALERSRYYRLVVDNIAVDAIEPTIVLYQDALAQQDWSIRGVKREPRKKRFVLFVKGDGRPTHAPATDSLAPNPSELPGDSYWEEI